MSEKNYTVSNFKGKAIVTLKDGFTRAGVAKILRIVDAVGIDELRKLAKSVPSKEVDLSKLTKADLIAMMQAK